MSQENVDGSARPGRQARGCLAQHLVHGPIIGLGAGVDGAGVIGVVLRTIPGSLGSACHFNLRRRCRQYWWSCGCCGWKP